MGRITYLMKLELFWIIFCLTLFLHLFSYNLPAYFDFIPFAFSLTYFVLKNRRFTINNNLVIYLGLLVIYGIVLFIGGAINLDLDIRLRTASYLFFYFIPISLVFYNVINNSNFETIHQSLFLSYLILAAAVYFLYANGYIAWNRYQQVGNILAALSILSLGYSFKTKVTKIIVVTIILFCLLDVGSRQAIAGLVFCMLFFAFFTNYKFLLSFLIIAGLVYLNLDAITEWFIESDFSKNYNATRRIAYALKNNGGESIQIRMEIYENLIQQIKIYPNLSFSPNNILSYPHNFFLEFSISCGLIIGAFLLTTIGYVLYSVASLTPNRSLFYFSLLFFIPFNVSTGFSAAKYFLYYFVLILVLSKQSKTAFNQRII